MNPVRIAVIGLGLVGRKHVAQVCKLDSCSLVGVCDSDARLKAVADELGVPFHEDVETLLQRERPDGAILATPNPTHAELAEICAKYSVSMLIEKPIAESLEQAARIRNATDKAGVRVLVGHHRRHNPLVVQAREIIQRGRIGRLVAVSVLWTLLKQAEYFEVEWRSRRPGGGPTLINLIHDIDNLRFICGEFQRVYAQTGSAVRGFEVEDSLSVSFSFTSGVLGTLLASDATPSPWSYELTTGENLDYYAVRENCYHFSGTHGSLGFPKMELWSYADQARSGWRYPLERSHHGVDARDPLQLQLEHFCRVVRGEESSIVDVADATRTLAVALAILESAERGNPMPVSAC